MKMQGDNMTNIKQGNRSVILRTLHEHGNISRKRLSEIVGLTPATVSKIIADMLEENLLVTGTEVERNGCAGRKEILLHINPDAYCALGITISVGNAILSAARLDGSVIFAENEEIAPNAPADETVKTLCERLMRLARAHQIAPQRVLGVGVALRGITDISNSVWRSSFGAIDQENYPLVERVRALTGKPVIMSNNVRALFSAQMFEARDRSSKSQYFLRCEYGIGAALSIDDQIWIGNSGRYSEIGHVPVVRRGGKPCTCGKCGCLETIASPASIIEDALAILSPEQTPVLWNMAHGKKAEQIDLSAILDAAKMGDPGVAPIVDKAITALASTLKTVLYAIDPAKIVLYGRLFEHPFYINRFLAELAEGVDADLGRVSVEKSPYNLQLEKKAACILVVDRFLNDGGAPLT